MITLFMNTGCPYCMKVEAVLKELNLAYEEKNISAGEAVVEELIARGGKRQVPYLVDGETEMYESDDMIAYLRATYGTGKETKPNVIVAGATCDAEGKGGCTF